MAGNLLTYQNRYKVEFTDAFGGGKDGDVYKTNRHSAVKFVHVESTYNRELAAYRLLTEEKVFEVAGHQIPRLIQFDDELRAIEMTIVHPPFIIDFAATYTDEELDYLDFPQDVIYEREQHWEELFAGKWPKVCEIRTLFYQHTGLHLLDLTPNNIRFQN